MTPQPSAPAPRKMSGCLIALLVVGGLAGLVCVGSAIAVFVAARSEAGKKFVSAIDQGVKMAEGGMNAPGAAELRAAGCPEALVLDMKAAMAIANTFLDAGFEKDETLDYISVTCSAPAGSRRKLPTCQALAPVYANAVPSERDFVIEVRRQGDQTPQCSQKYSGDGEFLADLE